MAMGIELILLVAGYLALASHAAPGVELFVICMSLALGLQNAAFRRTGGISVHTTYLTGMITGLIATEAEKYASQAAPRPATAHDAKVSLLCPIWLAFVLGATTGAAMALRFKALGMLTSSPLSDMG
jgi:uncharacterized membrane protein YoaK (UPF0700 family)